MNIRKPLKVMLRKPDNKGQGLVEFAVVIIVLVTAIYGVLVIGQIFHVKVVLNNAAREGVRYLSLHPTDNLNSYAGTKAAAIGEAQNSGVVLSNGDVTVPSCNPDEITGYCESGFPVQVRVGTSYALAWDWLFPSMLSIVSSARMMVP